ncbi:MAG: ABC transporter ATP-binding protein [Planctomycetota bacterium]|nr:ABC transporter ATP-binding protein [Planctomycetota bacterium]
MPGYAPGVVPYSGRRRHPVPIPADHHPEVGSVTDHARQVLHVTGLSKSFGTSCVLDDVSLEVDAGTVLGLVGPNGAGKTTCLRCLLGLTFADAGRVQIDGIDALADPVASRRRTGYLPGETSLYKHMRGQEALDFGVSFYPDLDREVLDFCLGHFSVPLDRKVETYSAGQKQMLAIMIAVAPDVPLHVLDEPDKGLDASMRHDLRRLIEALRRRGKALLVSSHHMAELDSLADEVVFLLDGKTVDPARVRGQRELLARGVRVVFRDRPADLDLPPGTVSTERGDVCFLEPAAGVTVDAVRAAVERYPHRRLSTGPASLQEVYEALYLGDLAR